MQGHNFLGDLLTMAQPNMKFFSLIIVLATLTAIIVAQNDDELADFNFESAPPELSRAAEGFAYPEEEIVKLDDVEVTSAGDNFESRERKIRQVLRAALTNAQMRQKFAEVIPVLRLMTKAQRLTLAALIQAQVAGDQHLTLEQVSTSIYHFHIF